MPQTDTLAERAASGSAADQVIVADSVSRVLSGAGMVLKNVSFQVPAGSLFGLIGPSGAGKTTLLRLLMNFIQPTAGEAHVLGVPSRTLRPAQVAVSKVEG